MNRLQSIRLERESYGVNTGKLAGEIKVANQYGQIMIIIDPEQALQILAILAPALVATARETASMMTADLIEQANSGPALIEQEATK